MTKAFEDMTTQELALRYPSVEQFIRELENAIDNATRFETHNSFDTPSNTLLVALHDEDHPVGEVTAAFTITVTRTFPTDAQLRPHTTIPKENVSNA